MAITFVGSATNTATNGGNCTVTFPGGVATNDVVVVFQATSGTPTANPSGYTKIGATVAFGARPQMWVGFKVMGGSPDANVSVTGTGVTSEATVGMVAIFRGVDTSSVVDVTGTVASGSSQVPNPPAITPSVDDTVVIACSCGDTVDASIGTIAGGFSTPYTNNASDTRSITAGACHLIQSGGSGVSIDPAAWSSWTASDQASQTFSLTPASTSTPHDAKANFNGSGALTALASSGQATAATWNGTGALSAALRMAALVSAKWNGAGGWSAQLDKLPIPISATWNGAGTWSAFLSLPFGISTRWDGVGTFSSALRQDLRTAALWNGVGGFNTSLGILSQLNAGWNGSGSFVAKLNQTMQLNAIWNGVGSWSAGLTIPGTSTGWDAKANWNGSGSLNANLNQSLALTALWSGSGGLSAAFRQGLSLTALWPGSGNWLADLTYHPGLQIGTQWDGVGSWNASLRSGQSFGALWNGQGSLGASLNSRLGVRATFGGLGAWTAALSGAGTPHQLNARWNGVGGWSVLNSKVVMIRVSYYPSGWESQVGVFRKSDRTAARSGKRYRIYPKPEPGVD